MDSIVASSFRLVSCSVPFVFISTIKIKLTCCRCRRHRRRRKMLWESIWRLKSHRFMFCAVNKRISILFSQFLCTFHSNRVSFFFQYWNYKCSTRIHTWEREKERKRDWAVATQNTRNKRVSFSYRLETKCKTQTIIVIVIILSCGNARVFVYSVRRLSCVWCVCICLWYCIDWFVSFV